MQSSAKLFFIHGWLLLYKIATVATLLNGYDLMEANMKKWQCMVCGFIYDEEQGWPDDGIEPGTRWEDVPEDWLCPDCGVSKDDFEMVRVG